MGGKWSQTNSKKLEVWCLQQNACFSWYFIALCDLDWFELSPVLEAHEEDFSLEPSTAQGTGSKRTSLDDVSELLLLGVPGPLCFSM